MSHNRKLHGFELEVSEGAITGHTFMAKFGYNPDVGNASETVWDFGGLYPWQSVARVLDVQSDSGSDTMTMRILGLDVNFVEIFEDVVLTGLTTATTTQEFLRVYRMFLINGNGGNVGNITVESNSVVIAHIEAGRSQTLMSVYTIPAGKKGYIYQGNASVGEGKDVTIEMYVRIPGGPFLISHVAQVYQTAYRFPFSFPLPLPARSDIDVRAKSTAVGTPISINFDVLLINQDE